MFPGALIEIEGIIRNPYNFGKKSGFDYPAYLARRGIHHIIYVKDLRKIKILPDAGGHNLKRPFRALRDACIAILSRDVPQPEAGFLSGVVLGDKKATDRRVQRDFQLTGTLHILVASGLNIGILISFCYLVGRFCKGRKAFIWILAFILIIVYTAVTGAQPPIVRAAIMGIIMLVGNLSGGIMTFSTRSSVPGY